MVRIHAQYSSCYMELSEHFSPRFLSVFQNGTFQGDQIAHGIGTLEYALYPFQKTIFGGIPARGFYQFDFDVYERDFNLEIDPVDIDNSFLGLAMATERESTFERQMKSLGLNLFTRGSLLSGVRSSLKEIANSDQNKDYVDLCLGDHHPGIILFAATRRR